MSSEKTVADDSKAGEGLLPYSHVVIITVLVAVAALPTGYFGYKVVNVDDVGVSAIEQVVEFDERYHEIVEVRDGDTVVTDSDEVIRLIGIEAPELDECGGEEARNALIGLVADRRVYFDKDQDAVDRFGRLLRYMYVRGGGKHDGDVMVNETLLHLGYALEERNPPNVRHQSAFRNIQVEAQRNNEGLWSSCETFAGSFDGQLDVPPTDENCVIKGNIAAAGKTYFLPGCGNYKRIKIDPRAGEGYFCSEQEAQKAGFSKSNNCR